MHGGTSISLHFIPPAPPFIARMTIEEELTSRLIFRLYHGSLPWTAGGEYLAFYRLIRRLLSAWKAVGLDMVFVFDGMSPHTSNRQYIISGRDKNSKSSYQAHHHRRNRRQSCPDSMRISPLLNYSTLPPRSPVLDNRTLATPPTTIRSSHHSVHTSLFRLFTTWM